MINRRHWLKTVIGTLVVSQLPFRAVGVVVPPDDDYSDWCNRDFNRFISLIEMVDGTVIEGAPLRLVEDGTFTFEGIEFHQQMTLSHHILVSDRGLVVNRSRITNNVMMPGDTLYVTHRCL